MYFKKLEILGFKSFAEKTTLHFEPGITAVVGPNGCGKSNVFDAIRWVLGEQSVKSLRGSKMEDVIFNGTEHVPALGYAEVSLSFANDTRALAIEYDEVTVTRRLFRSGESEYLINKTQVRLKDILELFMGTGIGAESYSLIEQGKIDLILSSRPDDRRVVFDEAAGISKYKSQKKETIRKLEDTEANLLRINDIIAEVKRQINSLERQAAKAKRYKDIFEKLKALETQMAAYQLERHQQQLDGLHQQLSELIAQEMQDAQAIGQLQQECNSCQQELNRGEGNLLTLRDQSNTIAQAMSRDSQQLGFSQERIEELKARLEALAQQKESLVIKLAQDDEKLRSFKGTLTAVVQELEQKKAQESSAVTELDAVNREIRAANEGVCEAKAKIMEFAAQEAALHNQLQEVTNQLNQSVARKKRLDIERLKAQEEISAISSSLKEAQAAEDAAYQKFIALRDQLEHLKAAYAKSLQEKEQLSAKAQALENQKAALESQREFLSDLKLRYENITESSKAMVFLDSLHDEKISGIILKIESIQKAQEPDTALMPHVQYKVGGIAKPISLDPQEVIDKIEQVNREILAIQDELALKARGIAELSVQVAASEKNVRESELEYNTYKNKKDNIGQQAKRIRDEFELVCGEASEIDIQLQSLHDKDHALNQNLANVKEASNANQVSIEQSLEKISSQNSQREKVLLGLTQLKAEIAASEEKLVSCEETCRILEDAYNKDKAAYESIAQEELTSEKRIEELKGIVLQLETAVESGRKQKELFDEEIAKNASFLIEARNKLAAVSNTISERKNILDTRKAKIHELQMQAQELTFLQNSLTEKMQQVYKIGAEELKNCANAHLSTDEASQEIELLKQKIESYGQVNLVAIEEFEELKQRYDFLTTQQEDLLKSKESLHEAILKINRTTKKMFLETFEKLVVEFKNYFRLLFGGGDAQLFLIDEQDVLESGIEIVCRPPGKKLQNVLLLSGGEKSMSAIALLFAIFKVKPSPFCVLDEIDAALDEANVDRYSRMLVDFTSQSQFIVITHNKKTIANANIMYGITMEKAGVSKIVSVKLADNLQLQKIQQKTTEAAVVAQAAPQSDALS